jgi:hypothetical protein
MKKLLNVLASFDVLFLVFLLFYACAALAQTVISPQDFLNQVLVFIQTWGGLTKFGIVAGCITLLISSMKVTYFNTLIWSKPWMVPWQPWVAPGLGLLAGIIGIGQTEAITPASVFAYVSAGAGALIIHQLLDTVKALPGIGWTYKLAINMIEGFLKGGKPVSALQREQHELGAQIAAKLQRGKNGFKLRR